MNRLERDYAIQLAALKGAGEIREFYFEGIKLRLADRCFYTPDFFIVNADGTCEFVEVKGFWRDDARVKWKVAAEQHPWAAWKAVQRKRGEWKTEVYRAR